MNDAVIGGDLEKLLQNVAGFTCGAALTVSLGTIYFRSKARGAMARL